MIYPNDVDKEENEEMTKLWRHFVRYDCKCAYALVMSDYHSHRSRFNNKQFEWQFESHAPSLQTSCKILHWKMHIGVIDLIAQKDLSKIKPEVKLLGCLKVLSLGVSFSTFCDYFQMGESSVGEAVSRFTCEVIKNKDKI